MIFLYKYFLFLRKIDLFLMGNNLKQSEVFDFQCDKEISNKTN